MKISSCRQPKWPKAVQKYQKFLVPWNDTDSGLPEIKDARKRLAGLQRY